MSTWALLLLLCLSMAEITQSKDAQPVPQCQNRLSPCSCTSKTRAKLLNDHTITMYTEHECDHVQNRRMLRKLRNTSFECGQLYGRKYVNKCLNGTLVTEAIFTYKSGCEIRYIDEIKWNSIKVQWKFCPFSFISGFWCVFPGALYRVLGPVFWDTLIQIIISTIWIHKHLYFSLRDRSKFTGYLGRVSEKICLKKSLRPPFFGQKKSLFDLQKWLFLKNEILDFKFF